MALHCVMCRPTIWHVEAAGHQGLIMGERCVLVKTAKCQSR